MRRRLTLRVLYRRRPAVVVGAGGGASGCLNGLSREVKLVNPVNKESIVLQLYFLFIAAPFSSSADLAENIGSQ